MRVPATRSLHAAGQTLSSGHVRFVCVQRVPKLTCAVDALMCTLRHGFSRLDNKAGPFKALLKSAVHAEDNDLSVQALESARTVCMTGSPQHGRPKQTHSS